MTSVKFKPMLSATLIDADTLRYPVLVSPKLDGVRCVMRGGVALSRNLLSIENRFVQYNLRPLPDGVDGELIVGDPTSKGVFRETVSAIKRGDGRPSFKFHVFDIDRGVEPFARRLDLARKAIEDNPYCTLVPHHEIHDRAGFDYIEDRYVTQGYEGVMIRDPRGVYKYGRSTVKEGGLMKCKRWLSAEVYIAGSVERQHNGNEATVDNLGQTKRSSSKVNKHGRGDLGALVCHFKDTTFEVGTGFTDRQRADLWEMRDALVGTLVEVKYQELTPAGVPRFPVFLRLRTDMDKGKF